MSESNPRGLKTFKSYVIGFVLSLGLTLFAFHLVASHMSTASKGVFMMSDAFLFATLMILAMIQLYVQVVCFLRLNTSKEGRWELMPFLFTIFVVLVVICGSLWIMYHLNYNMMH